MTMDELSKLCTEYGVPKGRTKKEIIQNFIALSDFEKGFSLLPPAIKTYRRNKINKVTKTQQQAAKKNQEQETYAFIENNRQDLVSMRSELKNKEEELEQLKVYSAAVTLKYQQLESQMNFAMTQNQEFVIPEQQISTSPTISPLVQTSSSFTTPSSQLTPMLPQTPSLSFTSPITTPTTSVPSTPSKRSFSSISKQYPKKQPRRQIPLLFNQQNINTFLNYEELKSEFDLDLTTCSCHDAAFGELRQQLQSNNSPTAYHLANMIGEHAQCFGLNALTGCLQGTRSKNKTSWDPELLKKLQKYSLIILQGCISSKTWKSLLSYWKDLECQKK